MKDKKRLIIGIIVVILIILGLIVYKKYQNNINNAQKIEDVSYIEISIEEDNGQGIEYSEPLRIENNEKNAPMINKIVKAINSSSEYEMSSVGGFFEGSPILDIYQKDGTKITIMAVDGFGFEGEEKVNIMKIITEEEDSAIKVYEVNMEMASYLQNLYK